MCGFAVYIDLYVTFGAHPAVRVQEWYVVAFIGNGWYFDCKLNLLIYGHYCNNSANHACSSITVDKIIFIFEEKDKDQPKNRGVVDWNRNLRFCQQKFSFAIVSGTRFS